MARKGDVLDTGSAFPEMRWSLVEGGTLDIPEDLSPGYGVVLIYRGHW